VLAAAAVGCAGAVALTACGSSSTGAQSAQSHPAGKSGGKVAATGGSSGGGSATAAGPVRSVQVASGAGSIVVKGTSGAVVADERVGNSMVPAPHKLSGGTLTVGSHNGSNSYYVQVPRSASVSATAARGAIQLTSLTGQVQATAASGTISGQDLSAKNATFSSHSGGIDTSFAAPPKNISATAQTGSVIIRVPRGASYQVNAHSGRGASQVMVPKSASAQHVIMATAGSGPVMVMPI
jgi:hypothetical protein